MTEITMPCQYQNRLLRTLPPHELAVVQPHLEHVIIDPREVVQPAGELIGHAYFIESGMVSLVSVLDDGSLLEVGTIGRGGVVGTESLHNEPVAFVQAVGQIRGEAYRLTRAEFIQALWACPTLERSVQQYRLWLYEVAAQLAACALRHDLDMRLARWLLKSADAVRAPSFAITQEHISQMLGVCRPSLSASARTLQDASIIRVRRGRIEILDRDALEAAACGCYRKLRERYEAFGDALLPQCLALVS